MQRWKSLLPIRPEERARFGILAVLLAVCALVQECNEIVATSGLVSRAGSANLLWAWTLDALLAPIVIGMYLLYAVFGVEEPAGHVFLAQVPEELRGRVSALCEGCFAPAGYILGCLLVVLAQHLSGSLPIALHSEHAISLALAVLCTAAGLWAACQLRRAADKAPLSEAYNTL